MVIGTRDPGVITQDHYQALLISSEILVDEFIDTLRYPGDENWQIDHTFMSNYLPRIYLHRYEPLFARQFLVTTIAVGWKLAQPTHHMLSCVAEELALHAIIERAIIFLEAFGIEGEYEDFQVFMEHAYEDIDFLFLFDPAMDGIQDSVAGRIGRMGHLEFAEWFIPFGEGSRGQPHPYGSATPNPLIERLKTENPGDWGE